MAERIKNLFPEELLTAARGFIVTEKAAREAEPEIEELFQAKQHMFGQAFMELIRKADEVANKKPNLDEFPELRWVPVAKAAIKACEKDMPISSIAVNSRYFDDVHILEQAELYQEAYYRAMSGGEPPEDLPLKAA